MNKEKLEARRKARAEMNEILRIEAERKQKPVKSINLNIEWSKSRTWGANPHLQAEVWFQDGTFERSPDFTCSGCGYDKISTVIAEAFNRYLLYKLWAMTEEQLKKKPYGIYVAEDYRNYSGGIGVSCYSDISEFIGGQWESLASGKTFDAFRYTEK